MALSAAGRTMCWVLLILLGGCFFSTADKRDKKTQQSWDVAYIPHELWRNQSCDDKTTIACRGEVNNDDNSSGDSDSDDAGNIYLKYKLPKGFDSKKTTKSVFLTCEASFTKTQTGILCFLFGWYCTNEEETPSFEEMTKAMKAFRGNKISFLPEACLNPSQHSGTKVDVKCTVNTSASIIDVTSGKNVSIVKANSTVILAVYPHPAPRLVEIKCLLQTVSPGQQIQVQLLNAVFGRNSSCTERVAFYERCETQTFESDCVNGCFDMVSHQNISLIQIRAFSGPVWVKAVADSNFLLECGPMDHDFTQVINTSPPRKTSAPIIEIQPPPDSSTTTTLSTTTAANTTIPANVTYEGHKGDSSSDANIIGGVLGTLICLALAVIIIIMCYRLRMKRASPPVEKKPVDAYYATIEDQGQLSGKVEVATKPQAPKTIGPPKQPLAQTYEQPWEGGGVYDTAKAIGNEDSNDVYSEPIESEAGAGAKVPTGVAYTTVVIPTKGWNEKNKQGKPSVSSVDDERSDPALYNHLTSDNGSREGSDSSRTMLEKPIPTIGGLYDTFNTVTGEYSHLGDSTSVHEFAPSNVYDG